MPAHGEHAGCLIAFQRGDGVVAVAPRFPLRISRVGWQDTSIDLPQGSWRNVLVKGQTVSGEVSASGLLASFPVALLVRDGMAG
jgi:(1->4)-alpha-D-glucan 1-alpha-D-glucosylmutase